MDGLLKLAAGYFLYWAANTEQGREFSGKAARAILKQCAEAEGRILGALKQKKQDEKNDA